MFRPAETLAVHIWKINSEGVVPDLEAVSNGTAAVLLVCILAFNLLARLVGKLHRKEDDERMIETRDLTVSYGGVEALHATLARIPGRPGDRAHRPFGLRQVHLPALFEPHEREIPGCRVGREHPLPRARRQ